MLSSSDIEALHLHVTKHAFQRARERFSWNASATRRMTKKAFNTGLIITDSSGRLKIYIDWLLNKCMTGNKIRLYGETIFIFSNNTLLTMWQLPLKYRNLAKVIKLKKEARATKTYVPVDYDFTSTDY